MNSPRYHTTTHVSGGVISPVRKRQLTCDHTTTHVIGDDISRVTIRQLTCEETTTHVSVTRELTAYTVLHFVISTGFLAGFSFGSRSASTNPSRNLYAPLARYESVLPALYFKDKTKTETSKAWRIV